MQLRGTGATGDDVPLTAGSDIPYECSIFDTGPGAQVPCDINNDLASIPGVRPNSDCVPTGTFNPCLRIVTIPTTNDCAAGGVCDSLGKASQCAANGFCVTGGLPIDLDPGSGSYTAGASGSTALFGWFDDPPGDSPGVGAPPVDGDGTWNIVQTQYTGVTGPIGLAVNAGGLAVQLECIMGIDSEPGIPNDALPTPDADLISFDVP